MWTLSKPSPNHTRRNPFYTLNPSSSSMPAFASPNSNSTSSAKSRITVKLAERTLHLTPLTGIVLFFSTTEGGSGNKRTQPSDHAACSFNCWEVGDEGGERLLLFRCFNVRSWQKLPFMRYNITQTCFCFCARAVKSICHILGEHTQRFPFKVIRLQTDDLQVCHGMHAGSYVSLSSLLRDSQRQVQNLVCTWIQ